MDAPGNASGASPSPGSRVVPSVLADDELWGPPAGARRPFQASRMGSGAKASSGAGAATSPPWAGAEFGAAETGRIGSPAGPAVPAGEGGGGGGLPGVAGVAAAGVRVSHAAGGCCFSVQRYLACWRRAVWCCASSGSGWGSRRESLTQSASARQARGFIACRVFLWTRARRRQFGRADT